MSKVTIIGGHGKVGLLTSKLLSAAGYQVNSLIRNPEQVGDIEATGAKATIFDLESASDDQFSKQFSGTDTVIWSAGAGGKGGPERTNAVDRVAAIKAIKGAQAAKVNHYITVSFLYADKRPFKGSESMEVYGDAKADADEFLKSSGLNWTIVGPGGLTDEKGTGKIHLNPPSDGDVNVSRENVALVLEQVVKNPKQSKDKTIDFIDGQDSIQGVLDKL